MTTFRAPEKKKKTSKNIMGKGENTGNKHDLFFTRCFEFFQRLLYTIEFSRFHLLYVGAFNLEKV